MSRKTTKRAFVDDEEAEARKRIREIEEGSID